MHQLVWFLSSHHVRRDLRLTFELLWSQSNRNLSAQICAALLLSIRLQELLVLCVVRAVALSVWDFSGR